MEVAELTVKLELDDSNAVKSLGDFKSKMQKIGSDMTKIGGAMTAGITTPLLLMGKSMFDTASDFEESLNKVNVAFGDSSNEVKEFAKTTLKQFGIAEGSALEMASLFGDMGTSMGLATKDASKMSTEMVGLAGDLASFKNIQIDVAQTALAGVFTGETESLKKLGIVMTETNLEQFAMTQGLKKNYDELTQAEKVQLRYAYVVEMSKNAIGDFDRTSQGAANQTRMLGQSLDELKVAFGEELLPLLTPFIAKTNELIQSFTSLDSQEKQQILQIAGLIAIIGPAILILGSLVTAITALLSPIGLAVLAIGGLITIIAGYLDALQNGVDGSWLFNNFITDMFDDLVGKALNWGKDIMGNFWQGFKLGWNDFVAWMESTVNPFLDKVGLKQDFSNLKADVTSYYVNQAPNLKTTTTERQLGVAGGISQTVIINAPTKINAYEVAKATSKSARALAVGLY